MHFGKYTPNTSLRILNYRQYAVFAALIAPLSAFAAPGGNESSIQSDQVKLKSAMHVSHNAVEFSVHEIQAASGTIVREYVTTNGTVFSIRWNGPAMPNLRQLLGDSFPEFTVSQKNQPVGYTQLVVQPPSLVVHSSEHMHAFKGNAYLPTMLPHGVITNDIL